MVEPMSQRNTRSKKTTFANGFKNGAGPSTSKVFTEKVPVSKKRKASISLDSRNSSSDCGNWRPERNSKISRNDFEDKEYQSRGLKHNLHGSDFQLKLLMLILWRAVCLKLNEFGLATEQPESEKFDDVVLFYRYNPGDRWLVRLYQAKHKEAKKDKFITRSDLMSTDNRNAWQLTKYMHSFYKIQRLCQADSPFSQFSGSQIEEVVIITNAALHPELQELVVDCGNVNETDKFIGFQGSQAKMYKLLPNSSFVNELFPIFEDTCDFNKLVRLLAESAVKYTKINKKTPIIREYLFALQKVLECDDKKPGAKFTQGFLHAKQYSKFREALIRKITSLQNPNNRKTILSLKDVRISISDGLAEVLTVKPKQSIQNIRKFAVQIYDIITWHHMNTSANDIIDISEVKLFNTNVCTLGAERVLVESLSEVRFSTAFIKGRIVADSIKGFRRELMKLIGPNFQDTIANCSFDINFKEFRADREECITQTLPEPYEKADIDLFITKLRIVVNYPNRTKIADRLEREMQDSYKNLNSKALKALLKDDLQSWMMDRIGTFYTAEKAENLFNEMDANVHCLSFHGMNKTYFSDCPKYTFKNQKLDKCVVTFLADNKNQFLNVEFDNLLFGRMRLVQSFATLQDEDCGENQRYTRTFGYIFCKESQLEELGFYKNIIEQPKTTSLWNLVIIECNGNGSKEKVYNKLEEFLKSCGTNRKVILITQLGYKIPFKIRGMHREIITTCFNDLTDSSQKVVGEKKIRLQGSELILNEIIDDSLRCLIDAPTLQKLLTDEPIQIGKDLQYSAGSDPNYYIKRSFDGGPEGACRNETEFVTVDDHQKLMIISGCAGMGKTTIISSLSKKLKSKFDKLWVIRINLNEYTTYLHDELTERNHDRHWATDFLTRLIFPDCKSKGKSNFEENLFENALKQPSELKVAILFDGFDEISPTYADVVLDLVKYLRETHAQKLIITTRPTMEKRLEQKLNTFAHQLRPFSQSDQANFLRNFWMKRVKPTTTVSANFDERLNTYIEAIIQTQGKDVHRINSGLTCIPLHLRLIAEIFEKDVPDPNWQSCEDFIASSNPEPKLPDKLNTYDLMTIFIDKKFKIYHQEKLRQDPSNVAFISEFDNRKQISFKVHQLLALYARFPKSLPFGSEDKQMKKIDSQMKLIEVGNGVEKCGLISGIVDGRPQFIHQRIVEYFVARYVGEALAKKAQHPQFYECFIPAVLECEWFLPFFKTWLAKEGKTSQITDETMTKLGQCSINSQFRTNFMRMLGWHESCSQTCNMVV